MEFLSYLSTLPNRQLAEAASGAYRAIFEGITPDLQRAYRKYAGVRRGGEIIQFIAHSGKDFRRFCDRWKFLGEQASKLLRFCLDNGICTEADIPRSMLPRTAALDFITKKIRPAFLDQQTMNKYMSEGGMLTETDDRGQRCIDILSAVDGMEYGTLGPQLKAELESHEPGTIKSRLRILDNILDSGRLDETRIFAISGLRNEFDAGYFSVEGYRLNKLYVHSGNHARDIFEHGFSRKYGADDLLMQGYGSEGSKGSIVSAFPIGEAYSRCSAYSPGEVSYSEDESRSEYDIYLPYTTHRVSQFTPDCGSVVFMSSGFEGYHGGDQERQAFVDCNDVPGALFVTNTVYETPELVNEEFYSAQPNRPTYGDVDVKDDFTEEEYDIAEEDPGIFWKVIGKSGGQDKVLYTNKRYRQCLAWISDNWDYASKFLSRWNTNLSEAASGTGRPIMNVYYRGFDSRHKLFGKYGGTWVTPELEYAVQYANTNGDGTVARISVMDSDERITTADDLMEILGIEPDMAIDVGAWPEWIEKLRDAGFNMVYNYLDDTENGYCILDPGIIRDVHVMTDEEIREEMAN